MIRWEGYNADGAAAVRWHEMNRDAAKADSFGVAERGNAVLRPQMTAMRPARQPGGDLLSGLGGAMGCAIVTGVGSATHPARAYCDLCSLPNMCVVPTAACAAYAHSHLCCTASLAESLHEAAG